MVDNFIATVESTQASTVNGYYIIVFYADPTHLPVAGSNVSLTTIGAIKNSTKAKVYESKSCTEDLSKTAFYVDSDDESPSSLRLTHFGGLAVIAGDGLPNSTDIGSVYIKSQYSFFSAVDTAPDASLLTAAITGSLSFGSTLGATELFGSESSSALIVPSMIYADGFPVTEQTNSWQIKTTKRMLVTVAMNCFTDAGTFQLYGQLAATVGTQIWPADAAARSTVGDSALQLVIMMIVDPVDGMIEITGTFQLPASSGGNTLSIDAIYARITEYPSGYTGGMKSLALVKRMKTIKNLLSQKKDVSSNKKEEKKEVSVVSTPTSAVSYSSNTSSVVNDDYVRVDKVVSTLGGKVGSSSLKAMKI